jgi:MerR family copper efflux transcriptional regulator
MARVTVGQAAARTGLTPKAVRLYERKGLLPEAERTESGYRLFTADDLDVLHFIRQAKALDLTLEEIKDVLDLQRCGEPPCDRVTGMLDAHIASIDRKVSDLRRLRRTLLTARRAADTARRGGHHAVVCQIIEKPRT